jgi:hypothetical protein
MGYCPCRVSSLDRLIIRELYSLTADSTGIRDEKSLTDQPYVQARYFDITVIISRSSLLLTLVTE